MSISVPQLVERFRNINEQRMQGMPFINPELRVEAVGFRSWKDIELGVLITPWFMNLILLPTSDADIEQGHKIAARFPSGNIDLTAAQDEELGLYFSAALFSSVMQFPDQETAVDIAAEIMRELFETKLNPRFVSRRAILTTKDRADA